MSAAELLALAERVERAEGPDRELDARVDCYLRGRTGFRWIGHYYCCDQLINAGGSEVPSYTASLDAALSLVPEGWRTVIRDRGSREEDKPKWFARLESADFDAVTYGKGGTWLTDVLAGQEAMCWAATPALALTAACLKAIASQAPQSPPRADAVASDSGRRGGSGR